MAVDWRELERSSGLRAIDLQVGRLMERLEPQKSSAVPLLASLASWAAGQGHTCLPLSEVSSLLAELGISVEWADDEESLEQQLENSSLVGEGTAHLPLILEHDGKLFLYRYHRCELIIAEFLRERSQQVLPLEQYDQERARLLLDQLFPIHSTAIDWQRAAAALALSKSLVVISGGPGTGKTYTVARILALVQELACQPLRMALVAPTGKAALRLQESIGQAKSELALGGETRLDLKAQTLHRLLGFQVRDGSFRFHRHNPLHLDLLVVDEASMIDVSLMAALLEALPARCRLLLLGDRDQLASVEAGNLFADICGPGGVAWSLVQVERLVPLLGEGIPQATSVPRPLDDSLVLLQKSRRFAENSGIGALAQAVNRGSQEDVREIFESRWPDVRWSASTASGKGTAHRDILLQFLEPFFAADSPKTRLEALTQGRILCGLREGTSGVAGVNQLVEQQLRRQQFISPEAQVYAGLPILISRNDYALGLFNGDTGVLWPDDQGGLRGWFEQEDGTLRSVSLAQLPAWQTSYAMTVHKSQGSEFNQVLLLLPQEDAPVLTRELLYTGITRAKQQLILCSPLELFLRTTGRQVIRYSGLSHKITTPSPQSNQE